nr:hypothetical protein CFP56_46615 [Quercus suber]
MFRRRRRQCERTRVFRSLRLPSTNCISPIRPIHPSIQFVLPTSGPHVPPHDDVSNPPVELDLAALAAVRPELLLEAAGADGLALREDGEGEREGEEAGGEDEAEVDGQDEAGRVAQPVHALQAHEQQRRQHHDGRRVEHARHGRLADGERRGLLRLAERGERLVRGLALLARRRRLVREDVDARADLLAAHEEDVERAGAGDGGEGHQAAEGRARGGAEAPEAGDEGVEAHGDAARRADGEEVGLRDLAGRQRGAFVRVRVVDRHVQRLVGHLPADRARRAEVRRQHARRHHQVAEDVAGHAEGQEDGLTGVCAGHSSSGVMDWILPCLYWVMRLLAFSSPALDVNNVLGMACQPSRFA